MKKEKTNSKVDIRALQFRMLVAYVLLLFFSIHTISTLIINFSGKVMAQKVSSLISANCQQIELNTDNYFNTVEAITTLLFADEKYYKYDPIANQYDDYSKIKSEEAIADRISDLGLMQNFTDFAVVYSDGNRVGWTSNTTAGLYESEELYQVLSDSITNTRTEDGWAFGIGGVTDRLYYIKRLNKNAVIMTSFYSSELETAFEYPEELGGMVINLVDKNNTILYSSETEFINNTLDEEIAGIVLGETSDNYIANANYCENGWSVVCAIPTTYILNDIYSLTKTAIIISLAVAVIMIAIGYLFVTHTFKPVDSAVEELKEEAVIDKQSGLFNKRSFNFEVCNILSGSSTENARTFVMIDVDNFKQVNDTLGHAYGDDVISRMGKMLSDTLGEEYIVGRVGGDEFAIFTENEGKTNAEAIELAVLKIKEVFSAFDEEFFEEKSKVDLSLSIGIAVLSLERRFDNLYKAADEALYISKQSGKNRYTIYESKEEEK